jgi:hypothetical protein
VTAYKYRALITLDATGPGENARQYPLGTHKLMVRCSDLAQPATLRYFPAAIYRADERPLSPGDADVIVTIEVADDEAGEFLGPGQRIALWNGHDIGRGVISRRVFFTWVT